MKQKIIFTLIVGLSFGLTSYIYWKHFTGITNYENINISSQELIPSQEEEIATGKWKDGSMDDLSRDAFAGDTAGLYMLGMCFLTGHGGWTIDTNNANKLFAISASLGFAPSLEQIRRSYLFEEKKEILSVVYLNLIVSMGHKELLQEYYRQRACVIDGMGIKIMNEIEKIATYKKKMILKNQVNKDKTSIFKLASQGLINDEDVLFDNDFWNQIANESLKTGNLEEWVHDSNNYIRIIENQAQKANSNQNNLASHK